MRKDNDSLVGRRFGDLTVVSGAGYFKGKSTYNVECVCGTTKTLNAGDLTRLDKRAAKSCGCRKFRSGSSSPHWRGMEYISRTYYNSIMSSAVSKGRVFNITMSYIEGLLVLQDFKCRYSGRYIVVGSTASLDRLDSSVGYIEGNVQWVHKDVNRLKSDFSEECFLILIDDIYGNKKESL